MSAERALHQIAYGPFRTATAFREIAKSALCSRDVSRTEVVSEKGKEISETRTDGEDVVKKTRVEIKLTFSADLDPVKGWGDNPNDWATMLEQRIGASAGGPYNVKLVITDINCRDVPAINFGRKP